MEKDLYTCNHKHRGAFGFIYIRMLLDHFCALFIYYLIAGPRQKEKSSWPFGILIMASYLVGHPFPKEGTKGLSANPSASPAVDNQWRDGSGDYWLSRDEWQVYQSVHLNFDRWDCEVVALLWLCLLRDMFKVITRLSPLQNESCGG